MERENKGEIRVLLTILPSSAMHKQRRGGRRRRCEMLKNGPVRGVLVLRVRSTGHESLVRTYKALF